jgi:hypothetical protein
VTDGDAVDWRGLNQANWDDRVPVHLASDLYDLDGFRAGASSLRPFEVLVAPLSALRCRWQAWPSAVAARWEVAERYGIRGRTGGQVPP